MRIRIDQFITDLMIVGLVIIEFKSLNSLCSHRELYFSSRLSYILKQADVEAYRLQRPSGPLNNLKQKMTRDLDYRIPLDPTRPFTAQTDDSPDPHPGGLKP